MCRWRKNTPQGPGMPGPYNGNTETFPQPQTGAAA